MVKQLIECVPNFSEGRRKDVIAAIVAPFREQDGCYLFDYRADEDHNRLVVSLVGEPKPLQDALIAASLVAREHIDMNTHTGAHPRIGAVDVIPFVPLRHIDMSQCIVLAHEFGRRFHAATDIPVYFYEAAASIPERQRLEVIRKGQYEGLVSEMDRPERLPDVGPPRLHPTAGASVVGARRFLVAFNVNLKTSDITVARRIAGALRGGGGGLSHVKAIGVALKERGMVQVSVNILDYRKNPLYRVLEFIRMEARRWGVAVGETELYGMVPAASMLESLQYYMQVAGFDPAQILELKLLEMMGDNDA